MVEEKTFCADLYYRLSAFPIGSSTFARTEGRYSIARKLLCAKIFPPDG